MLRIASLLSLSIILFSCGSSEYPGYKKTDTGLFYNVLEGDSTGPTAKIGDRITFHMDYSTMDDSLIFATRNTRRPAVISIGEPDYDGDFQEGLTMMRAGDSASFLTDARMFYLRGAKTKMPEFVSDGDLLKFNIRMIKVEAAEEVKAMNEAKLQQQTEALAKIQEQEMKKIIEFLQNKGWGDKESKNGIFYIEHRAGSGKKVQSGSEVTLHYTGTLTNGTKFNSSYDHNEPMQFRIGEGMALEGLERGLKNMRAGGKATLIIPSEHAYGLKGLQGTPIGSFEPLVFEIDLLKVR